VGKASTFEGTSKIFRIAGANENRGVTLEPFYQMHGNRSYVVYWDLITPTQWQVKEEAYKAELAREKELEARTVDAVKPGFEQNERDHRMRGDKTGAGEFGGRKWRHATEGGWFSWELKVQPDQPQQLQVTYWGGDGGSRVFDVLIDNTKLATQRLQNNRPDKFYEEVYPIPAELIQGKQKVTVKFQAHPANFAGGIFECRIMKPEAR
jgi:hypothetical protein